jgi:hypothetical protein
MNASNKTTKKPTRDEIATRAYQLWEKDGRKPGEDWKYWLRAETELLSACPAPSPALIAPTAQTPAVAWSKPAAKSARAQAR